MQIQLRQTEIKAALTAYIAAQGINLAGKAVEITFTAGRKESGLSADIEIEDAGAVSLIADPVEGAAAAKPTLTVVPNETAVVEAAAAAPVAPVTSDPDVAEAKPAGSLFN